MTAPRRGRTTNERILAVLAVGLGMLGVLWLRCVYLQVLDPRGYAKSAEAQHRITQPLPAERGTITDRNNRPLAVSIAAPSVFADARRVGEKSAMASRLARLTGGDAGVIRKRLERDKGFVWIARQVDYELMPTLLDLRDAGIGTQEELRRVHPQGRLGAHLLGFVNIDHQGLEGLELTFNRSLRGQDGFTSTLRDAKGDLLVGPWTRHTDPVDGGDLQLTIDSVVQQAAEEALDWGAKTFRAKGGSVIVMDPYTGEILAMANYPTYDPGAPGKASPERRRNRAVTDLFEPGSIFKIVTAAALLEE
ncbi:MAG: penicillin-binding transpeptidase domain-containing protein, partial [Dehalococcoidia bacterium]|nr:penicillin-binding transpeptidase domain-containing protein [Dehalococcoidia bacterium]